LADEYVISVVLEGDANSLANATNQGADAQKNLKTNTDDANLAFLAQVARYQAMTAALNQTIGGMNKLAGGLEAIGLDGTIGAEGLRKLTKGLELIAGPAEIYLAYMTLTIAMGKKDTTVKGAQTAATGGLTKAIWANTTALLANPMFWIAAVIVTIIAVFYTLEKRFGLLGNALDTLLHPLELVKDFLEKIQDVMNGIVYGVDDFVEGISAILNPGGFIRNKLGGI
jgi:hypothetical protein